MYAYAISPDARALAPPAANVFVRFAWLKVAVWTLAQGMFVILVSVQGRPVVETTVLGLPHFALAFVLSSGVQWVVQSVRADPRARQTALIGAAVLSTSAIHAAFDATYAILVDGAETSAARFFASSASSFISLCPPHAFIAASIWIGLAHEERLAKERLAIEAEARAQTSALRALRAHINPDFVIDALRRIGGLVRRRDEAEQVIHRLSDFLRASITDAPAGEVTLAEELAMLEAYADLARLTRSEPVSLEVACPSALDAALAPDLVLQQLMNAALEGARGHPIDLAVTIQADDRDLSIAMASNAGAPADARPFDSILADVRGRLAALSAACTLTHASTPSSTTVAIRIPLRFANAHGAARERASS